MYNSGPPQSQRRPGGAPTPAAPDNQFNFDGAAVGQTGGTYRQSEPQLLPEKNPHGDIDAPVVRDDVFMANRSASQTRGSLQLGFNDGNMNYSPFPEPQGFSMMRGTSNSGGPAGNPSSISFSNPFPQQHNQAPYLGNRAPYYQDTPRITQRAETPFDDYPSRSSYSGSRSESRHGSVPPHHATGYHRGSQSSIDVPSLRDEVSVLTNELSMLTEKVKRLVIAAQDQEVVNRDLKDAQEELTQALDTTRNELAQLREQVGDVSKPKPTKDGSNKHPALKRIVHPLFASFCGIEWQTLDKEGRVQEFLGVHPLENGEPFEVVDGVNIWHPNFKGSVSERVNRAFLEALVKAVIENEKALREKNCGELPDEDFKEELVRNCAKTYFRNIHKSFTHRTVPEKAAKLAQSNIKNRRRGRRSYTATKRRKAADQFEKETSLTGAQAMIDTDFCSDSLTCDEDELDAELRNRRNQMGFGKGSEMRQGLRWRSTNYVAFMRHLAFRVAGGKTNQHNQGSLGEAQTAGSATGTGQPPQKKRRTTKTAKQVVRTVWDAPPSMMYKKPPQSSKKPIATRPFSSMVDPKWQDAHLNFRPLTPNPNLQEPTWLTKFYDEVKGGKYEVMQGDLEYLKELDDWRRSVDESGDEADDGDELEEGDVDDDQPEGASE